MSSTESPLSTARLSLIQRILFGSAIFLSAFLLLSIEPLTAKRILPWFGGSAAVWSTCLVFYQTALLAGYGYALLITRFLTPFLSSLTHLLLLGLSLLFMPIGPSSHWRSVASGDPSLFIFVMLLASIAVPFLALSATSPLLQHWIARTGYAAPYRLFALSNFASLAALLSYPLLVEPWLDTQEQSHIWSILFGVFAVLCGVLAWVSRRSQPAPENPEERVWILPDRLLTWFALSACGSMLLLSITNHMDENIAAVPLLWVVPLSLYLLTFVVTFGWKRGLPRALMLRLLAFALGVLGYSLYNVNAIEAIQVSMPLLLAGLFFCCLFCHGELNRLRPSAANLTTFYLVIAAGGAVGAICVGVLAPRVFDAVYELPVTLAFTALLAALLTWRDGGWPLRALWIGVTACMLAVLAANWTAYRENALAVSRNFYGSLRVVQSPHAGPEQIRTLFHGTIEHGAQYVLLPNRLRPTTYYGPDSGVGILLREGFDEPKRVGIVGLGTGTLAAYGKAGDTFRFYEINEQVTALAQSLFSYLRESKAMVSVISGDARLSLAREPASAPLDVLVLDAFSGDAIPVHLLTREAMLLYCRRLKPDGVLAVNVSNNFLDLAPVVEQMGTAAGWSSILVRSHQSLEDGLLPADWVLVTNRATVLKSPSILAHALPISPRQNFRLWTDSYNNLWTLIKTPTIR